MLSYLRDQLATVQLRARYQRLVHQRLVQLTESSSQIPSDEDEHAWQLLNKSIKADAPKDNEVQKIRQLVRGNPHACNVLRLMEAFIVGPGLELSHQAQSENHCELVDVANRIWRDFLRVNAGHYSFQEHARRTWRDGECFIRKFSGHFPVEVRFLDPEMIGPSAEHPGAQGILTRHDDIETPLEYLKVTPGDPTFAEHIPAADMLHTRYQTDTNEKRGTSLFAALVDPLIRYESWMETELQARKLQSSIVLWRKVQGSPQSVDSITKQAGATTGRERIVPGTILTTNHATDIQFLQPNTNFGDAVSLGRMLLLQIAAGAGLPEFMLTADASNANFASTMVAEGPAVKFFQAQQNFFANEFERLWTWVMEDAVARQVLPQDFFEHVAPAWTFPQLVNRDRAKERMADVRLVEAGVLSRSEIARREGTDPKIMKQEIASETATS